VCLYRSLFTIWISLSLARARSLSQDTLASYLYTCMHASMHTCLFTYTYTHARTRARTHTHTHTHIHNHGHGRSEETRRGGMGGYGRPGAGEMYSAHNMRSTGYMTMDMARMYDTGKGVEDYRRMVHTHIHTHTHTCTRCPPEVCAHTRDEMMMCAAVCCESTALS